MESLMVCEIKNVKKEIRISEFETRTQADLWTVEKN